MFRSLMNKYLHLKQISKAPWFEILMFIIVIINVVVIILGNILKNEDSLLIIDLIDDIILYIYITEALIKIIGLGIVKYWDDGWN